MQNYRKGGLALMAAPGIIVGLLFFVLPLLAVLREAFTGSGSEFLKILKEYVFWKGLGNTLVLGTVTPAASLLVGFAVAWHLSGLSERTRTAFLFWISLPLTFSGLIIAYAFILSYGRSGFMTLLLAEVGMDSATLSGFLYSPAGLGFAYSYYLIPRVVLMILPVLVNFDKTQLITAESLGATRMQAVFDIMVPQVLPAAAAAYCLVAAVAIGAYGTALALVGSQLNILPLQLFSRISGTGTDFPGAAALSVLLMLLCSLVLGVGEIYAARKEASHGTGS